MPLHHVFLNGAAVATQQHDPENGSWLSRHHDLPSPPRRRRDLGFALGPSLPHRLRTSPSTLLRREARRREARGSEEGKPDAARGSIWGSRGPFGGEEGRFWRASAGFRGRRRAGAGAEARGARDPAAATIGGDGFYSA